MQIAVIGTGYVGLVAGACFSDTGNNVICVDKDQYKIDLLKKGKPHIYEPGLEEIVRKGLEKERLRFTTDTTEAVQQSDIIFMAVNTPSGEDGAPDLSYLKSAVESVARAMNGYKLIVNKSTVPVGTFQQVADWMKSETSHPYDVVSNPEFLKEGCAVDDFLRPDRVIIGTASESAFKKMESLYQPFVKQGCPIIWMDPVSAELTKYACNSFLATRISFMNELSQLCEKVGGDIEKIRKGMSSDERIGRHFLYAGMGYGGSCFPKDVKAILHTAEKNHTPLGIIQAAEDANERQKRMMVKKIKQHFGDNLQARSFSLWGLSFKPNTDDIREAPSLVIIDELLKAGASIRAVDAVAEAAVKKKFGDRIQYCKDIYEAAQQADGLILVTEWNEFKFPDFSRLRSQMRTPVVFDGRNIYDPATVKAAGFTYYGVGRS